VIVVVGLPVAVSSEGVTSPAGTAARVALAAAAAGAGVQLVGKVGDDPAGDAVLLALARGGVGHVAVLRDPSRATPVVPTAPSDDGDPFADGDDGSAVPVAASGDGPAPTLEPADVELALRYLTDFRCLVLAEPLPEGVVRVAAEAARYSGAELVVVAGSAVASTWNLPAEALVLGAPDHDRDGDFARVLGDLAAAVDRGLTAAAALTEVTARIGAGRSG
jgi:sugar/nucleoside kinase (ribokinase family)